MAEVVVLVSSVVFGLKLTSMGWPVMLNLCGSLVALKVL